MAYTLNNTQKKIALYCMLNEDSRKYEIHCITSLGKGVDLVKFKRTLLEVLNHYPIFKCTFNTQEFCLEYNKDFNINEISVYEESTQRDKFFQPHVRINDDRLLKCAIVKEENGFSFLLNIHHVIFDVYSGFLLLDSIFKNYHNEEIVDTKTTSKKIKRSQEFPDIASNYSFNFLKEYYGSSSITQRFNVKDQWSEAELTIREKSALAIYTIADLVCEITGETDFIIGVPVPNRKDKKGEMGCFVNTLPVRVTLVNNESIKYHVKDITKQLFRNLRYQDFDFQSEYRRSLMEGEFPILFTYYPSDFEYNRDNFKMKGESIQFPERVSPLHMTMRDDGKVDFVTSLRVDTDRNIEQLLYKNTKRYIKGEINE